MNEKPKKKDDNEKKEEKQGECETGDKDSWSRDQREKSYYYDDSYGYEIYNPDEDDDEDE